MLRLAPMGNRPSLRRPPTPSTVPLTRSTVPSGSPLRQSRLDPPRREPHLRHPDLPPPSPARPDLRKAHRFAAVPHCRRRLPRPRRPCSQLHHSGGNTQTSQVHHFAAAAAADALNTRSLYGRSLPPFSNQP
ncbi:hypothetical protein ACP70R_015343 [Stipagrostis hirtigluma subsp. patula]